VFVDGQNLFHAARAAFDRTYPDYDVHALGRAICASNGWTPNEIRFYTREDIHAAIGYAADTLAHEETIIVTPKT